MTYMITKDFEFSASHQLDLGPDHPCSRLHGHNYVVRLRLSAEALDARGMVVDYGELAPVKQWIDDTLDHCHLNDTLESPTAERLAHFVWLRANPLLATDSCQLAVGVSETPKTWAWFS